MKTCRLCGQTFPATSEYFPLRTASKDGFRTECRTCHAQYHHDIYIKKHEENLEYARERRAKHPEKVREINRLSAEKGREKRQAYYEANREKRRLSTRRWRENNPEKDLAYKEQYKITNRDRLRAKTKAYMQKNPEKYASYNHNRRARKRGLPNTLTEQEINRCLEYFNYTCPVCGNQLRDLFGEVVPHIDHWIPLASPECLGTVAKNIVLLCSGCNQSKHMKMPLDWLTRKYGTKKAKQILARIRVYFDSLD